MGNKDFYYQLKIRQKDPAYGDYWGNAFFKGIVQAKTSKEAREIIKNEIFGAEREFKKGEDILLSVLEITEERKYLKDFFKPRICKQCGNQFSMANSEFNAGEFCCQICYEDYRAKERLENQDLYFASDFYASYPVIYRIYDKKNNKNYIGQTIRSFTLRWWEHYKSWINFVENTNIIDFEFSVLEVFEKSISKEDLTKKEQFYINQYDSLKNGYNSVNAKAEVAK